MTSAFKLNNHFLNPKNYRIETGTWRNDLLVAPSSGFGLFGQAGNDVLTSTFNKTLLVGGIGNDRLEIDFTNADYDPLTVTALADNELHEAAYGGNGDDDITVSMVVYRYPYSWANPLTINTFVSGGNGDDTITVSVQTGIYGPILSNVIFGGGGNDSISARADAFGDGVGVAQNEIKAGAGNDVIDAVAGTVDSLSVNEIWAGSGDDVVTALAAGGGESFQNAENTVYGQSGDDVISVKTSTGSNNGPTKHRNYVDGGAGNDELSAIAQTGNDVPDIVNYMIGRTGDDKITAVVSPGLIEYDSKNRNVVDAGAGNDTVFVSIDRSGAGGIVIAENVVNAGKGDDHVTAFLSVAYTLEDFLQDERNYANAHNYAHGGAGNDEIIGEVDTDRPGGIGHSELFGGVGDDVLTAIGGDGNILNGGVGADRLFGSDGDDSLLGGNGDDELISGAGDDDLTGGAGRDVFAFDATSAQGAKTITDFDASRDVLRFFGVTDAGAPGLADDLDAISTFADNGMDVTVTLDTGTILVFEGVGSGSVSSFADLVDDPFGQLLSADDVFTLA